MPVRRDILIATGAAVLTAWPAPLIALIPDFLPVIGYADDTIIVAFVLRSVVRRAGIQAVRAHWPGTEDGFAALARLTGLQPRGRPRSARRRPPNATDPQRIALNAPRTAPGRP
jgi:uncharacterized membrane protein YkvA (DUF1232 family)